MMKEPLLIFGLPADQIILVSTLYAGIPFGALYYRLFVLSPAPSKVGAKDEINVSSKTSYFKSGNNPKANKFDINFSKHAFIIVVAIAMIILNYNWTSLTNILATILIAYLFMRSFLGWKKMPLAYLIMNLSHLSIVQLRRYLDHGTNVCDYTSILMVLTIKFTSLAYDLDSKDGDPSLSGEFPSILEFFSYGLLFPGLFSGPIPSLAEFRLFCATSSKCPSVDKVAKVERRKRLVYLIALSFLSLLIHFCLKDHYNLFLCLTPEFASRGLLYKNFFLYVASFMERSKFYFVWAVAEASYVAMGMGHRRITKDTNPSTTGKDDKDGSSTLDKSRSTEKLDSSVDPTQRAMLFRHPKRQGIISRHSVSALPVENKTPDNNYETLTENPQNQINVIKNEKSRDSQLGNTRDTWDRFENVNPWQLETCSDFRVLVGSWNRGTNRWLYNCVYARLLQTNLFSGSSSFPSFITYFVSSLWHGFYPAYYVAFISAAWMTNVNRCKFIFPHHTISIESAIHYILYH